MKLIDQFYAATVAGIVVTEDDLAAVREISLRVPGYSDLKHHAFFKTLFALPVKNVLVLGVYHGRDICFMKQVLGDRTDVAITGVDKFSDTACADWPEKAKGLTWLKAGFGNPPSLTEAWRNTRREGVRSGVTLFECDDAVFLCSVPKTKFDAIYLDTSHDRETVLRQCRQVRAVCAEDALICGDDYSDVSNAGGSWGVKQAVTEVFTDHLVFSEWIWVSSLDKLKL